MLDKDCINYINDNFATITEIAKALKLSRQTIYKYRVKNKVLTIDELIKISIYLNKTATNSRKKFDNYLGERITEQLKDGGEK